MTVAGKSLIAGAPVDSADGRFVASGALARFEEASAAHVGQALEAAAHAFDEYRRLPADTRAAFLDCVADEIAGSSDLIDAAHVETSLARERLVAERARTVGQLRMFANVVREGSWVDTRIDSDHGSHAAAEARYPPHADPDRPRRRFRSQQFSFGVFGGRR